MVDAAPVVSDTDVVIVSISDPRSIEFNCFCPHSPINEERRLRLHEVRKFEAIIFDY